MCGYHRKPNEQLAAALTVMVEGFLVVQFVFMFGSLEYCVLKTRMYGSLMFSSLFLFIWAFFLYVHGHRFPRFT